MSKFTKIEAGYRITVESWENDADNYNTKSVQGYSLEEALFAVELFQAFSSCNSEDNGIGNLRGDDKDYVKYKNTISEIVSRHPIASVSEKFKDYFQPADEDGYVYYSEYLYDLGLGGTEYSLTRVCESVMVEYIPQDILIEDVTDQF